VLLAWTPQASLDVKKRKCKAVSFRTRRFLTGEKSAFLALEQLSNQPFFSNRRFVSVPRRFHRSAVLTYPKPSALTDPCVSKPNWCHFEPVTF
jgi:hypothetical protein